MNDNEIQRAPAINPLFGIKIRETFDPREPQGFGRIELAEAYHALMRDPHEYGLILEAASFEEVDSFYNPSVEQVSPDFVLEAIVIDKFSKTEHRMKAVCRVMKRMLGDSEINVLDPVVGKPKKSGGFAYVTVQLPFSDGQVVSVIFHSPEGDKKRIGPQDTIIAFRWLLNKRDITHLVSPEDGTEVPLEKMCKRVAQLVIKNSARFEATQKEAMAEKQELDSLNEQIEEAEAKQETLIAQTPDTQKEIDSLSAQIENQKTQNAKLKSDIAELEAKIAAMKQAGQAVGPDGSTITADLKQGASAGFKGNPELLDKLLKRIDEAYQQAVARSANPMPPQDFAKEQCADLAQAARKDAEESKRAYEDIETGKRSHTGILGKGNRKGTKKQALDWLQKQIDENEAIANSQGLASSTFFFRYESYLKNLSEEGKNPEAPSADPEADLNSVLARMEKASHPEFNNAFIQAYKRAIPDLLNQAVAKGLNPVTITQYAEDVEKGLRPGYPSELEKDRLFDCKRTLQSVKRSKKQAYNIDGKWYDKEGYIALLENKIKGYQEIIDSKGLINPALITEYHAYLLELNGQKNPFIDTSAIDTDVKQTGSQTDNGTQNADTPDPASVKQVESKIAQIEPEIEKGIDQELEKEENPDAKKAKKEVVKPIEAHEIEPQPEEDLADTRMAIYGRTQAEDARYEIMEADEVQASHLPEASFQKNPKYGLENERRYHAESASQEKVLQNAQNLNPDILLRDSVDANQGAPVIDQDNNVLGGNSRAMSIRVAYAAGGKQADAYREELKRRCKQLGIDPAKVDAMKKPMLVRRLKNAYSLAERQALVTALNDSFTDSKETRAAGKTRGDRLGARSLALLSAGLQDANTLRDFFDLPGSKPVVDQLIKDGVIRQTEKNALVGPDGLLNPDGKRAVEEALRGRIARDYDALAKLPCDIIVKLDAIAPSVLIAEGVGASWNMTEHLRDAVDLMGEYKSSQFCKRDDFHIFLKNIDMMHGNAPVDRYSKIAVQIFLMLLEMKKAEIVKRFKAFATDATQRSRESGAMEFVQITAQASAKKNLGIDLGTSAPVPEPAPAPLPATPEPAGPEPAPASAEEPAFIGDLNDILNGKYDSNTQKLAELFEKALDAAEASGNYAKYENLLEQASNHYTELLNKKRAA